MPFQPKPTFDSIFKTQEVFATYRVGIAFRDRVIAGIPNDPGVMESWIRAKTGVDDTAELIAMMKRSLMETHPDLAAGLPADATYEDILAAARSVVDFRKSVFKRSPTGLHLESRQVKAMLREATATLYAGERWGLTSKGAKAFLAERVHIEPGYVYLCRPTDDLVSAYTACKGPAERAAILDQMEQCVVNEPDGTRQAVLHVSGPQGLRDAISAQDYVEQPVIIFRALVAKDELSADVWDKLWVFCQENGLGAMRSQDFGRFNVFHFEREQDCVPDIRATHVRKVWGTKKAAAEA